LRRGVSCGAVAGQVKGDTQHIEKRFPKIFGKLKKPLAHRQVVRLKAFRCQLRKMVVGQLKRVFSWHEKEC